VIEAEGLTVRPHLLVTRCLFSRAAPLIGDRGQSCGLAAFSTRSMASRSSAERVAQSARVAERAMQGTSKPMISSGDEQGWQVRRESKQVAQAALRSACITQRLGRTCVAVRRDHRVLHDRLQTHLAPVNANHHKMGCAACSSDAADTASVIMHGGYRNSQ